MIKMFSFLFLLIIISSTSFSQITIKEFPFDNSYQTDSVNYANTLKRKFIPLDSNWQVFVEDSKIKSLHKCLQFYKSIL